MKIVGRLLFSVIASGLVFAQLADNVHLAMVPHEVCAEHGELVEPSDVNAARPVDALDGHETHFDRGQSAASVADHEHCLATAVTRLAATQVSRVEAAAPRVALVSPREPVSVSAPAVDVIRLAPKQSPPAA